MSLAVSSESPHAANVTSVTAAITAPGQMASFTFAGTSGQRVSVHGALTSGSYGCGVFPQIRKPDDTPLQTPWEGACGSFLLGPVTLPASGTYTILVDPPLNATGTSTIAAYDVPPDVTGSLTINAAALPVSISFMARSPYAFRSATIVVNSWCSSDV